MMSKQEAEDFRIEQIIKRQAHKEFEEYLEFKKKGGLYMKDISRQLIYYEIHDPTAKYKDAHIHELIRKEFNNLVKEYDDTRR